MKPSRAFEFPPDKARLMARARRLEWWSLAYLVVATLVVALVLGQSQAMKTAWLDDVLNFIPVIAFLVATRMSLRPPNENFPYGYHRASSAAYLGSAVALFTIGGYLLIESAVKLAHQEHPTIGTVELFGQGVWLGWLMIPALIFSAVPAMILGHLKLPLAKALYDKALYTDAKANKADWLTELAAIAGIVAIGYGYWWADAVAAIIISFEIVHDGYVHLRVALLDLLDQRPHKIDDSGHDPIIDKVRAKLLDSDWVKEADVRLRVSGHTLLGEAYVVPVSESGLVDNVQRTMQEIRELDWRLHGFTITPVESLATGVEEKVQT